MSVYLEKVDPDRYMRRFYQMRIEPTLFGEWALIREWGRIGSRRGQKLEQWFETAAPAEMALRKLEAVKRRRGYGASNQNSEA